MRDLDYGIGQTGYAQILVIGCSGSGKSFLAAAALQSLVNQDIVKRLYYVNESDKSQFPQLPGPDYIPLASLESGFEILQEMETEDDEVIPTGILFDDLLTNNKSESVKLRRLLNYSARRQKLYIFVISHHLYNTGAHSIAPFFSHVVVMCFGSNVDAFKIFCTKIKAPKMTSVVGSMFLQEGPAHGFVVVRTQDLKVFLYDNNYRLVDARPFVRRFLRPLLNEKIRKRMGQVLGSGKARQLGELLLSGLPFICLQSIKMRDLTFKYKHNVFSLPDLVLNLFEGRKQTKVLPLLKKIKARVHIPSSLLSPMTKIIWNRIEPDKEADEDETPEDFSLEDQELQNYFSELKGKRQ